MKPYSFKHPYHKLANREFTTIRGKAQFKLLKVGQCVPVETLDGDFLAIVTRLELKRVTDLSIQFLKADAEYPGFTFYTHAEFVTLLNSFRATAWPQLALDSEVTVIYLKRTQQVDSKMRAVWPE